MVRTHQITVPLHIILVHERAVVLTRGEYLEVDDLTLSNLQTVGDSVSGMVVGEEYQAQSLSDVERIHIQATLDATGWNKSRTASILGIERSTLDRKIKRYELADDASPKKK